MSSTRRPGRPFLAFSAAIVLAAAVFGSAVGAAGQASGESADLLGVVSFPMTPATMAGFGVAVSALILTVLFGLAEVASRYESERPDPER